MPRTTKMNLFRLPNVSSYAVEKIQLSAPPTVERPAFRAKEEYMAWIRDPKTEWAFLSCFEGVDPGKRVTSDNPPFLVHGFVAEFDAPPGEDWLKRVLDPKVVPFPPNWVCHSFSGNARAWWRLEKPFLFPSKRVWEAFAEIVFHELKAHKIFASFEFRESADPYHYFEVGTDWTKVWDAALPADLVAGWVARAVGKLDWSKEAVAVPIDTVRKALAGKFGPAGPRTWPGGWDRFDIGARGHRFWVDGADASSVIVVESGLVSYTGDKWFLPWSAPELLGGDWVRQAMDTILGAAIKGIYYDAGRGRYFANDSNIKWLPINEADVKRRLAKRGLSAIRRKGEDISPADDALVAIQKTQSVDGAFPAIYRPQEIVVVNGRRYLNTARVKLTLPDPEPAPKCPVQAQWLLQFLRKMFGPRQLPYYLAWLRHYYLSCLEGKPKQGLFLFIAGPTGCGKTFLNMAVHRQIFGGAEEATQFLIGKDRFNMSLFGVGFWTIDDAIATSSNSNQSHFSQAIKALVANQSLIMRGMYREGLSMPYDGRVCVTMNADPESLRMLPSTEVNMMDKVHLLKAYPTGYHTMPSDEEVAAMLPYFLAYLRDWQPDPKIAVGGRFGVKPYHHPHLIEAAEQGQDSTHAEDLIELWARHYFGPEGAGADAFAWTGKALNLQGEFMLYEDIKELARSLVPSAVACGRFLTKLINRKALGISSRRHASGCLYVITREVLDKPLPRPEENVERPF